MKIKETAEQLSLFDQDTESGRTCREPCQAREAAISKKSSSRSSGLKNHRFMLLDLRPGAGNMLGPFWEYDPAWLGPPGTLDTSECPKGAVESSLSQILVDTVPSKYFLSSEACKGILRRARERGKELPEMLGTALKIQAGIGSSECDVESSCPVAFAANQQDEVRDLHDVAGAFCAHQAMKQKTFVTEGSLTPWDTQQQRIFTGEGVAPTLAGADGGGGRNPAGLLFSAAFSANQGPKAGGIGYAEEYAPTLKAAESSTNMVPSVLCLNDQGGQRMDIYQNVTGTLRSQMDGHPPLVYENYGIDSRYTGPLSVSPTLSARCGTGGNNIPLVEQEPVWCITGNAIDRQPQNGGNGCGWQESISYTLTATDRHSVYSRQRVDVFKNDDVASTQSARQHKDATDLVCQFSYQDTVGALTSSDRRGPNNQYVSQDKCVIGTAQLIRRLIPLECERLQGFPDNWTDIPRGSDAARYKALGNSVAVPCVEYLLLGVSLALPQTCNDLSFLPPYNEDLRCFW